MALPSLAALAVLAAFEQPLAGWRPQERQLGAAVQLLVTSSRDAGPGSLREAILAAGRATGRARIAVRAERIVLQTPLPPLVNSHGVTVQAEGGPVELDARALPEGAVLEVAAPGSVLQGLTVRGAPAAGILVREGAVRLEQMALSDCETGVHLVEGVAQVVVEASSFSGNVTGIRVEGSSTALSVQGSRFERHGTAGIWAVAAEPPPAGARPMVVLRNNRFRADRMSVILINVPSEVADNQIEGAVDAGLYLTGPAVVRGNRIQGSAVGVFADAANGAVIEGNELDRNLAVGVLLRGSRATQVRDNRLYVNGYGIAVVFGERGAPNVVADNLLLNHREDAMFVVGGSPVVRDNRGLSSRQAGLRILDYVPRRGPRLPADPLLLNNVFEGNGSDVPPRGLFHEPEPPEDP